MIHAVRVTGGLPGSAIVAVVSDGDDTILLCDAEQWSCEQWNYDLLNALFAELMGGDGEPAVDGPLVLHDQPITLRLAG